MLKRSSYTKYIFPKSGRFEDRLTPSGQKLQVWVSDVPLLLPEVEHSVVFMFRDKDDAEAGLEVGGTGFILRYGAENYGRNPERWQGSHYVVTCDHVIDEYASRTWRLNEGDERPHVEESAMEDWHRDYGHDLAVLPIKAALALGGRAFPARDRIIGGRSMYADLGYETVMVGCFSDQPGSRQNAVSVRFGQVSQTPSDPIPHDREGVQIKSFMVDVRHIQGGYSGSPVYSYLHTGGRARECRLVGVCWGHWPKTQPIKRKGYEEEHPDWEVVTTSGMALVVPGWDLLALLDRPELAKLREKE